MGFFVIRITQSILNHNLKNYLAFLGKVHLSSKNGFE